MLSFIYTDRIPYMAERFSSSNERLFLANEIPDSATPAYPIIDTYISIEESIFGLHVVRARYKGGPQRIKYQLRVDHGREYVTTELSKQDYEKIKGTQTDRTINKNRHMVREGSWSIGIDVYEGAVLGGLAIAGVRAQGNEPIERFDAFDWMSEEITDEPVFVDHRLVRMDKPPFGEIDLGLGKTVRIRPLETKTP